MSEPTGRLRLLHITPWFPTDRDPGNAVWIQRHVECLKPYAEQHVLHIEIEFGGLKWKVVRVPGYTGYRVRLPFKIWRLREWLSALLLWWFCIRKRAARSYDVANFHIAYPLCVHLHRMRHVLPHRVVITEHTSFYHFHFYSSKSLRHIKRMFHHEVPVVAVSKALAFDMQQFAGRAIAHFVLPNVVNTDVFRFHDTAVQRSQLFMAAYWKTPKDPIAIIHALQVLREKGFSLQLRIGGWGPLLEEMKEKVQIFGLTGHVFFLGRLSAEEMAQEFNRARAFILPSAYETFSVVCAEAMCCGCPVLTESLGALPELVTPGNGLTREAHESWSSLIERFMEHTPFNRQAISAQASQRFNPRVVGQQYAQILTSL